MKSKLKQIRVDGYKNLINCVVNLGDFNVLVGPNNSGKSNLLEAIQMLGGLTLGSDSFHEKIINEGWTPPSRESTWVCHLDNHSQKNMTIGISFETQILEQNWIVDYEIAVEPKRNDNKGGIVSEFLKAKEKTKTGPATTYFLRDEENLQIKGKMHPISRLSSSVSALKILYPDYKDLPEETTRVILTMIVEIGWMPVFAIWPDGLRFSCNDDDAGIDKRMHMTRFNPLQALDDIQQKDDKLFDLLRETFCDALDMEDLEFKAGPLGGEEEGKIKKRFRECLVKRKGNLASNILEFSDGTFCVLGILAAYLSPKREDPLFLLEEMENCLHPKALEKMLRFFQDTAEERPVLLTTHSPYLVNKVNPSNLIISVVDENGATTFQKIEDRKKINAILNNKYLSFGDLMPDNFSDVLKEK